LRGAELTVADLAELALSRPEQGEDVIKTFFDWRVQSARTTAIAVFAATLSFLAAFVVALVTRHITTHAWQAALVCSGAVAMLLVGFGLLRQARRLSREYLVAIQVYAAVGAVFTPGP
jgi:uncharacterized membrane protein YjjP (DUF1212 family)